MFPAPRDRRYQAPRQAAFAARNTKLCKFYPNDLCRKGEACAFAHGKDQLQPQPDLQRMKMCPAAFGPGGSSCRTARSTPEETRKSSAASCNAGVEGPPRDAGEARWPDGGGPGTGEGKQAVATVHGFLWYLQLLGLQAATLRLHGLQIGSAQRPRAAQVKELSTPFTRETTSDSGSSTVGGSSTSSASGEDHSVFCERRIAIYLRNTFIEFAEVGAAAPLPRRSKSVPAGFRWHCRSGAAAGWALLDAP